MVEQDLTTIIDEFEREGVKHRVLGFISSEIKQDKVEPIKKELTAYLTPGETKYDPSSDYCIDFSNIDALSIQALFPLISMNKLHKEHRQKPLTLSGLRLNHYALFSASRLTAVFNFVESVEAYKQKQ